MRQAGYLRGWTDVAHAHASRDTLGNLFLHHKEEKMSNDEQGDRIKEAVREYYENPQEYSYLDFEEMFEDRDPFEFL